VVPDGLAVAVKLTVPDVPSGELLVLAESQFAKLRALVLQPVVPVEKVKRPPPPAAGRVVVVLFKM
jgi:hypothetical protein